MQALWAGEGISNNAILVVQCDGPISPERIRKALDRFLDACPWPAARLRRPFPWGKLHWAAGPRAALRTPPVAHRVVASADEVQGALEAELNATIDPRREAPLRCLMLEVAVDPLQTLLVFIWFHPLMDPRGAQNLLMHLGELDGSDARASWGGSPPAFVAEPDLRSLQVRGRLARRSLGYMRALTSAPPVSPGTGLVSPGRVRFRQDTFVGREADICSRLALVGKAMAALWERRPLPAVPFLVPIAVDLRLKGDPGPTFGNMLAFHFARFTPGETADVDGLARTLRRQLADAVRDGQIEANAAAMEFLHYRPVSFLLRELPGTAARETFSFNCADVADFPAVRSIFGRSVLNAYHVPAVLPRPGIGVFFNRCGSRNNLVASWIDGAVTEAEVARIVEVVREGMGWITPA
jgi:hypothetical protein